MLQQRNFNFKDYCNFSQEIWNKIERGDKFVNIANEFGVGCATIHNIRKNNENLKYFFKNNNI